jgi:ferritin-like metal-binding protein YciE
MEKMTDLKDLFRHEILDLYSAEEQIIEALPLMIDKAQSPALKKALINHLEITEKQKRRLERVKEILTEERQSENDEAGSEKQGFLSRLFGGNSASLKCRGMAGLIEEGEKIMSEKMSQETLDAVIIACAQKIEHYEIAGYGTAKAYARQLGLKDAEKLLDQTLSEEYEADDLLTELAVTRLNIQAEQPGSPVAQSEKLRSHKTAPAAETRPNTKEASTKKAEATNRRETNASRSGSSAANVRSTKTANKAIRSGVQAGKTKKDAVKSKKQTGKKRDLKKY